MTIWKDLGAPWCILNTLVLLSILCEFRYPRKKTALLICCLIGPLASVNVGLYLLLGSERISQIMFFTLILPAMCALLLVAKYRDGRFLFTFFGVCTVSTLVTGITNLLDFYLPGDRYVVMFVSRLLLYPLLEWVAYRWLRKPYLEVQREVKGGWAPLSVLAVLHFLAYIVSFSYPSMITNRPDELPGLLLVMATIPMSYVAALYMLLRQLDAYRLREREQLLHSRVTIMQQRVEQTARTEELLSIQRHDLRHRFLTLDGLLEKGRVDEAREYIAASDAALAETASRRWCENPVLDAVFSSYFGIAEAAGIRVEAELDVPAALPVDAAELSTVFANALENAIHAVQALPEGERVIRCRCIRDPQLMFLVSNTCASEVRFDEDGRPCPAEDGHGLGIRSIEAYCEKNGAYSVYKYRDGWFTIRIVQP